MMEEIAWKSVPKEIEELKKKVFGPQSNQLNMIVSEPFGVHAQPTMEEVIKEISQFEVRSDDIWIVTYPKCGTTWTQEMVWQIVHDLDIEAAKKAPLTSRTTFIEFKGQINKEVIEQSRLKCTPENMDDFEKRFETVRAAASAQSPRLIKTHLPFEFLPSKLLDTCKVIFVCRNPKDCCVSFYHHHQMDQLGYEMIGNFSDFAELFLSGGLQYGSYWTMLKSGLSWKKHPNLKILWYEEMKANLMKIIEEVSEFLGYQLTQEKICKLNDHLHIDNFRKIMANSITGDEKRKENMKKFIRKGQVGDWMNYFNNESNEVWDKWISENLTGSDIVFPHLVLQQL